MKIHKYSDHVELSYVISNNNNDTFTILLYEDSTKNIIKIDDRDGENQITINYKNRYDYDCFKEYEFIIENLCYTADRIAFGRCSVVI